MIRGSGWVGSDTEAVGCGARTGSYMKGTGGMINWMSRIIRSEERRKTPPAGNDYIKL